MGRRRLTRRFSLAAALSAALLWLWWRQRDLERLPRNEDLTCSPPRVPPEIDITPAEPPDSAGEEAAGDALERIRGIGPVFAGRLRAAGIRTFAALAAQSPEHLRAVVQAQPWQKVDPQAWIAEARLLMEA